VATECSFFHSFLLISVEGCERVREGAVQLCTNYGKYIYTTPAACAT
jgi:hypothetical protein